MLKTETLKTQLSHLSEILHNTPNTPQQKHRK